MIRLIVRDTDVSRAVFGAALFSGAMLLAACSGGSGSSTITPHGGASPHPSGSASASPSPTASASPTAGPAVSPTPLDSNHVAFVVKLGADAIASAPNASASSTYIYITGQQTTAGPNATCSSTTFEQVTDAHGTLAPFPTGGAAVTGIPFYGNGTTSGTTSQVIQLPQLCSGRIYISVNGPLTITSTGGPAPWAFTGANGYPAKYDMVEYTMPANGLAAPSTDVDTSQENMIDLDLGLTLTGTQAGSQSTGAKSGFMTQVSAAAASLGTTWRSVINSQWPTRLLSPLSVQYIIGSTGNTSLPGFNPGTFLDGAILSAWNNSHRRLA